MDRARHCEGQDGFNEWLQTRKGTPDPAGFGVGLAGVCALADKRNARIIVVGRAIDDFLPPDQLAVLKSASRSRTIDLFSFGDEPVPAEVIGSVSGYVVSVRWGGLFGSTGANR